MHEYIIQVDLIDKMAAMCVKLPDIPLRVFV